jgi:hypothetical protein
MQKDRGLSPATAVPHRKLNPTNLLPLPVEGYSDATPGFNFVLGVGSPFIKRCYFDQIVYGMVYWMLSKTLGEIIVGQSDKGLSEPQANL